MRTLLLSALIGVLLLLPLSAELQAQSVGAVVGRVLDAAGNPLPGATVEHEASGARASSGTDGSFLLKGLPSGSQALTVSYLGWETKSFSVDVPDSGTIRSDLQLEKATYADNVVVTSNPILQGQARALNQQKNAPNIQNIVAADQIGRFPDPNAAEATQRIPGLTLERDQGEGRYVIVRGTEPSLTSTAINGVRLPSPEGGGREVALDVIPADLLEAIEVSKALTPDMDADAIGGAVNLVTKVAPANRRVSATAGWGYNELTEDGTVVGNFTAANRFNDSRTGIIVAGSLFESDRGSDNIEPSYDDGELDELELRDYTITRERYGLTATLDHQPNDSNDLRLSTIWNEFSDQEFRRRVTQAVSDNAIERELKDRYEVQQINSINARGSSLLGGSRLFEYGVSWSDAEEEEPGRFDTTFELEDVEFAPNVSPGSIDPGNIRANPLNEDISGFVLADIAAEDNLTTDEELAVKFDFSVPFYRNDSFGGLWKFGAKGRFQEKNRNIEVFEFEADDLFLLDFGELDFQSPTPFFGGQYDLGIFPDPSAPSRIIDGLGAEGEKDFEEDLGDYETTQDTLAAYGMVELQLGQKTSVIAGLRYEQTDNDFVASELLFDEEGDFVGLTPIIGSSDYSEILPMVHLRHELDDKSNVRAAITRTLARPQFADQVPFELLLEEDGEIERGNADLEVATSLNLDLLYERYFESVGIISAGVFYKDISDNIFTFNFDEGRLGDIFEVTQPLNGDGADVLGFEFAFQNRFRNLPAPFDGLGLYFNLTLADSESKYPEREPTRLQGQADEVANLALSYEKAGFSGRLSYNFTGDRILEVGGEAAEDNIIDEHSRLDFSARQQLTNRIALALDVINLTDEPYRVYEGFNDRTIQEEIYSWWATLSLKIDFQ